MSLQELAKTFLAAETTWPVEDREIETTFGELLKKPPDPLGIGSEATTLVETYLSSTDSIRSIQSQMKNSGRAYKEIYNLAFARSVVGSSLELPHFREDAESLLLLLSNMVNAYVDIVMLSTTPNPSPPQIRGAKENLTAAGKSLEWYVGFQNKSLEETKDDAYQEKMAAKQEELDKGGEDMNLKKGLIDIRENTVVFSEIKNGLRVILDRGFSKERGRP